MPTTQAHLKAKTSGSGSKSSNGSNKSSLSPVKRVQGPPGLMATGPKLRATKINFPVRKRKLTPEEKKLLARQRWKKAIRRVKAMLRFNIKFTVEDEVPKEPVKYAPTYKMIPDSDKRFDPHIVSQLITTLLADRLKEYEYSRFTAPKFAKVLSGFLNDKVKEFDFPRFKFVTNVVIVENKDQGVHFASRCAWNPETDEHATGEYKSESFIAVASIHGVYLD